ncbi:MAG: PD40 domain-containing protein [Candidatus Goldbacteria bacterium]|nr:PD40 domain-containing protein [Candidatus Goldiibacteriota bacterium]
MKKILITVFMSAFFSLPSFGAEALGYIAFVSARDGGEQIYLMQEDASLQTRITNKPGYAFCEPKISPDGSEILAVGYKQAGEGRAGNADIYIMDIDGANLRKITDGASDNTCPIWMLDGKQLIYASKKGDKWSLYTMDTKGENKKKISGDGYNDLNPSLSPDGKVIVFQSDKEEKNIKQYSEEDYSEEEWDEYSVPDGKRVEFVNGGTYKIYVMDIDGKNRKRLTNYGENHTKPFWSPDGKKLYYFDWYEQKAHVFKMDIDGNNKEQTALYMEDGRDGSAAWVIGGRIPIFSVPQKDARWRLLHGLKDDFEPVKPVFYSESDNYDPCALPATAQNKNLFIQKTAEKYETNGIITFTSRRDGGVNVYIMCPDGSLQRKLTDTNGGIGSVISPDRKKIYYVDYGAGTEEKINQIFVMNIDGTEKKQLTSGTMFKNHIDCSPDGKKIIFIGAESTKRNDIYVMNSDGSQIKQLTDDEYHESDPKWSPDGKRIVFSRHKDKRNRVFVMDSDGKNQKQVTKTGDNDDTPCWSPDGKLILFEKEGKLMTVKPDGKGLKEIECEVKAEEPFWSPDGKKIVFKKYGSEYICVIDADGKNYADIINSDTVSFSPYWR